LPPPIAQRAILMSVQILYRLLHHPCAFHLLIASRIGKIVRV
jgi:hypothetical protein